jgi:putative transposase
VALPSSPTSLPQGALAPPQIQHLAESFNFLLERRRFGKCHSLWRILQIARAIALNYNLSTCYLVLVIILQDPLFLHEMFKYIQ